jgi:UDP-N-acetylglucosamine 4,6-dehydratase
MSNVLKASVVAITGGTGSFGSTMVRQLLSEDVSEIRVFSRDESKQDQMRKDFKDARLKFIIGDVRDPSSIEPAIDGVDYMFHAAALKQVPSCEFYPMQAVATNIIGSSNVINSAIKYGVKSIVCLSTDKAVYPINAMGMTKALMEKVAQSYARNFPESKTKIAVTRYGNVMMSRGSVIPLFLDQIRRGNPISITDKNMTRFMMSLDDSVSLVKYAFTNASTGDLFVKKAPACSLDVLVQAISRIMGVEGKIEINEIGIRHGEKLFESLLGSEEASRAVNHGEYFQVPIDARSQDYQIYFSKGQRDIHKEDAYTSNNTVQLGVDQAVELITNLPEFLDYKIKHLQSIK